MRKTIQTSFNFQEQSGEEKLTSSQQASPASRSATQEREKAVKTTVSSGRKILEFSERLNQDGSFARTFRGLLLLNQDWYSSKCALTWRMKATKYNRLLFQLVPKMRFTGETEFGLLRTPMNQEAGARVETLYTKDGQPARIGERAYRKTPSGKMVLQSVTIGQQIQMLPTMTTGERRSMNSKQQGVSNIIQMLPTTTTRDWKGARKPETLAAAGRNETNSLEDAMKSVNTGLKLQPAFAAWMMGFPEDWTLLPFQKANGEQNP